MKPQKHYPHNVDICVTCVSEKPPQLPLREELPSLGIEVVYNAQGIGAKASEHESKKLVKEFREKEQVKDSKPRFFPQSAKKVKEKQQERKLQENNLRIPKALSYQSYEKRLLQNGSTDSSSSVSSGGTNSTANSSGSKEKKEPKKSKGWGRFRPNFNLGLKKGEKQDSAIPLATVEFSKPEDNALKEAYSAFAEVPDLGLPSSAPQDNSLKEAYSAFADVPDLGLASTASRETQKTPSRSKSHASSNKDSAPSEEPSSQFDPSTLSTKQEDFKLPRVELTASPSTRTQLPGLVGSSGRSKETPSTGDSSDETSAERVHPGLGRSDAISEQGTSDVYTSSLSSKKIISNEKEVRFHSSPDTQLALPNLPLDTSFSTKENSSTSTNKRSKEGLKGELKQQHAPVKEFFDLTALSEEDISALADLHSVDKDVSTLSSKKDGDRSHAGVQVYPSYSIQNQLPELLKINELNDEYSHSAINPLSSADEESVPSRDGFENRDSTSARFSDGSAQESTDISQEVHQTYVSRPWKDGLQSPDFSAPHQAKHLLQKGPSKTSPHNLKMFATEKQENVLLLDGSNVPLLSPSSDSSDDINGDTQASQESVDVSDGFDDAVTEDSLKLSSPTKTNIDTVHAFERIRQPSDHQSSDDDIEDYLEDTINESLGANFSKSEVADRKTFRFSRISPLRAAQGNPTVNVVEERLHKVSFSQDVEERYYETETVDQLDDDETGAAQSGEKNDNEHDFDPVERFYEDVSPKHQIPGELDPEDVSPKHQIPGELDPDDVLPKHQIPGELDPEDDRDDVLDALADEIFQNTLYASGISNQIVTEKIPDASGKAKKATADNRISKSGQPGTHFTSYQKRFGEATKVFKFELPSLKTVHSDGFSEQGNNAIKATNSSSSIDKRLNMTTVLVANNEGARSKSEVDSTRPAAGLIKNFGKLDKPVANFQRHLQNATSMKVPLFSRLKHQLATSTDPTDGQETLRPAPQDPPTDDERIDRKIHAKSDSARDSDISNNPSDSDETPSNASEGSGSFVEAEDDPARPARIGRIASTRSESKIIAALSMGDKAPDSIARTRVSNGNRFPLHVVCDRELPDRFAKSARSITDDLVTDISSHKRLIEVIAAKNMDACTEPDAYGDLPVHLLARRLMEWEARWYQKVYEKAREENRTDGENSGISKLYQSMSQIIDILLLPVVKNRRLCRLQGSVGRLLPLHIAAIFTVSYKTLRLTLEGYPDAAAMSCDLKDIRTFIPANSLPLQLHDKLSTDFPKWELDNDGTDIDQNNSSRWERLHGSKNCLRRSDLILAFNPDILPYRREAHRIRRIESRIRDEASSQEEHEVLHLSPAIRRLWIWLCTFQGQDENDSYVDSVMRIVDPLTMQCVRKLAMLATDNGSSIIDVANMECSDVIMERLRTIADSDVPVPIAKLSTTFGSAAQSPLLKKWEDEMSEGLSLQGRGHVAVLCRTVFHITEERFPTSFVFLPYKLLKDKEGRLGLESPEAANIAMRFADCLLQLTSPRLILHFLENKAIRFLGQGLGTEDDRTWYKTEADIKVQVDKLLSLYEFGPAYFYFLDELTGMPVVPGHSGVYPFVVNEPLDMIKKILPLMLTGMILMRGEKALPVIANIILSKKISVIQSNWIAAAKDIVGYLHSPQTEWTTNFVQDLLPLKNGLIDLIDRGPSENAPRREADGLASEWVVELSLVRMVVEMHDTSRSFAGLRPKRGRRNVLWTRDTSFFESQEHRYRFDFKAARDLREDTSSVGDEQDETSDDYESDQDQSRSYSSDGSSTDDFNDESNPIDAYEHLFGDLAIIVQKSRSDDSSENDGLRQTWSGFMEPGPAHTPFVPKKPRYASEHQPISLLTFDESLGLDDILQLRIQLDEQEARLDFLNDKIKNIQASEVELIKGEEALGAMLDKINKSIVLDHSPDLRGLTNARKLLIRISDLEERVLCREIEMQQLKMDVEVFELEASEDNHNPYDVTFTLADSISTATGTQS